MTTVDINYQLANSAGYKFNIIKIGNYVYDPLAYYHKDNFPDIEITRPGSSTDMSLLHNKTLMTVNGYVHPTTYVDERLFIGNATKSMSKSKSNSVGILSFNKLSSPLVKTQITPDMVTAEEQQPMFNKAIITFSRDIGVPILCVCGYLIFENPEYFYRVSSNSFALRLDKLNYLEKLYELNRYRDIFADLEVPVSPNNSSMVDATVVRSNEVITRFLSSYNSFLVEVPTTSLTTSKLFLEQSNVPGNFRIEQQPFLPMIVGYGKIGEYIKRKTNDTKFTVYVNDAYYNNHIFSYLSTEDIQVYNDHRLPGRTYRLSPAFFLKMTVEQ